MPIKVTTESFIAKAKLVHNNKYDYSLVEYTGNKNKITIVCPIHGSFDMRPDNHLNQKQGCSHCYHKARVSVAKSEFNNKASIIHNNKYSYEFVDYKNSTTKVKINCPIHGIFEQQPSNHLTGNGCAKCAIAEKGWSRTHFKDFCIKNNNGLGILYVLECFNDSESFIKIGITSNSIKQRYDSKAKMPYEYTVLHEIIGDPEFIYDLETLLHKKSKHYKYNPSIPFGGSLTECFEANPTYLDKLNIYLDFKRKGIS